MFRVTDGHTTYIVYSVTKITYGLTEFLIYVDGVWKWVDSDLFKPVNK